jgi:NADPH2:quinone reductase
MKNFRFATLIAGGEIDPQIELRTSWDEVSDAAEALLDRRVAGKAVSDVK